MAEMSGGAEYLLKLNQSLAHLGTTVEKLNKTVKVNTKITKQLHEDEKKDKTLKDLTRATELFTNGMGSILSKQRINYELSRMSPLNASMFRAIAGSVNQQMDQQRIANGFGRSLRDVIGRNAMSMRRGTGGFTEQVTTQMSLAQLGMAGRSGQSTRDLATGMRLTGQNEQKLIQALRESTTIGGTTNQGLEVLSLTLNKTSKEYGISTELLLDGIASVEQNLNNNLMGITESLDQAVMSLGGKYGGRADLIRDLVQKAIDPSNRGEMMRAGVYDLSLKIADSNTTAQEQTVLIEQLINTLGPMAKQMTRGGSDSIIGLGLAKGIYGDAAATAASLASMEKNTKASVDQQSDFNDNFDVWGKELLTGVEKFTFDVFGQYQKETVGVLTSIEGLIKTAMVAGGITAGIKAGVILHSAKVAGQKAGWNAVLRAVIGLPAANGGSNIAGEATRVAGTATGARVAAPLIQGATGTGAAAATGGGAAAAAGMGLGTVVLGALAVVATGYILSKIFDSTSHNAKFQKSIQDQLSRADQAISDRRSARMANPIGIASNVSRASGNSSYEIISINTQREQNKMLQDIVKELKRGNTKEAPVQFSVGGM